MIHDLLDLFRKARCFLKNYDDNLLCKLKKNNFEVFSLQSNEPLVDKGSSQKPELIVSLTSYSSRINTVHLAIESIGFQTVKANKIILWLDKNEFNECNIPLILKRQMSRGLEIKYCENIKSYKKLIPSLIEFPESSIITIDDDILYPYDMIEQLVREHKKYPQCIISQRAHRIKYSKEGDILPYSNWGYEQARLDKPDNDNFMTTGAGTLFPRKCFNDEVFSDCFLKLCPSADDVWFNAMARLNGTKIKKVNDERNFSSRYLSIGEAQSVALSMINVEKNMNDVQINNVNSKYSVFKLNYSHLN